MRVLIVGAGPAGAALGLLLSRHKFEVTLLDREPDFERVFRGEALMPSSLDAINQMGFRDELPEIPHRVVECMEFYMDGSRILRADWPEVAGPNAAQVVSQPRLLDMLTRAARRSPTFTLRMSTTVRDVHVSEHGVVLDVDHLGEEETIRGDFVVGADGRASTVRARAGLKLDRLPFPFNVTWFSLPLPQDQQDDPRFQGFRRDDTTVVMYPSWDDKLRIGYSVSNQPNGRQPTEGEDLIENVARAVNEPRADFIRRYAADASEPMTLKVLFGRCAKWSAHRTLLIGDAAHPMSPVRSQGINLALRDAIVAANYLVPAFQDGSAEALETAAAKIQLEREPEVIESQRLQVSVAQPPPPARSLLLRRTALPILRRLGVVKRLFLQEEIPLRHGVVPVRLTV